MAGKDCWSGERVLAGGRGASAGVINLMIYPINKTENLMASARPLNHSLTSSIDAPTHPSPKRLTFHEKKEVIDTSSRLEMTGSGW